MKKKLSGKRIYLFGPLRESFQGDVHTSQKKLKNYYLPKSFQTANINLKRRAVVGVSSLVLMKASCAKNRSLHFRGIICVLWEMQLFPIKDTYVSMPLWLNEFFFHGVILGVIVSGYYWKHIHKRCVWPSASVKWVSRPFRYQTFNRKQVHKKIVPQLPSSTYSPPVW